MLFHGTFIHSVNGELQILENTYMTVENGKITSISDQKPEGHYRLVETTETQIIIPGLIDTHTHAPQYSFAGCGLDLPLLEWLNTYTYPAESKFSNKEFAEKVYNKVVNRSLSSGTTTSTYFGTLHKDSTFILADQCRSAGQRAFVGKLSMDRNSPDYYREKSTEESLNSERQFLNEFSNSPDDLVQPILTPRFVPTCSLELMKGLGQLEKENPSLRIQSHVSENLNEIEWVKSLHPDLTNYTSVYDHAGLLNSNTILAHGVHLTDDEINLLATKNASISHCPSSNFLVFSGQCDVRKLMNAHVNVGLGTDVAGGGSISMMDAMRNALTCSRSVLFNKRSCEGDTSYKALTIAEAFTLATENGARALNLQDKIGNFQVGKEFDALLVDMNTGMTDCFGTESKKSLLDKFVIHGDDRNILRVYVRGKLVKGE